MGHSIRLALLVTVLIFVRQEYVSTQTGPVLFWDEDPGASVTGYAVTIDGVRVDYGLAPLNGNLTCGCSIPLPFTGGQHTIIVSAYSGQGETQSAPLVIAPAASAGGPYTGQAGRPLNVNAGGSSDPTGMFTSYSWSWGDRSADTTTSSPGALHTYVSGGTFAVAVTVTDNAGATASASTTAAITPIGGGGPGSSSLWNDSATPSVSSWNDTNPWELGVKFRADVAGSITGIRFYKGSANTGTHVGNLWASDGSLLASATFTGETATGWQQVTFATPVAIAANTTYVASYHTDVGGFALDLNHFTTAGVDSGPLHALADGVDGGNGVYQLGASAFPNQTYNASNYWVDVVFTPSGTGTGPAISGVQATAITPNSTKMTWNTDQLADSQVDYGTTTAYGGSATNGTLVTSHSVPLGGLSANTVYHYRVKSRNGAGIQTTTGDFTFTTTGTGTSCPCSLWSPSATPAVASANDTNPWELGVKFRADVAGSITGIRFYKGSANTGTHVGHLWTSGGRLLASATFTSETATGWQQVTFATPVAIAANTTYVASYHTNVGGFALDLNQFTAAGVDSAPLHALADGVGGGNGVYRFGASGFPSQTYNASNYWVDVIFRSK